MQAGLCLNPQKLKIFTAVANIKEVFENRSMSPTELSEAKVI